MIGYKGFTSELKCRNKQYSIGETAQEEHTELCNRGLHFCENPMDCFSYYPPSDSRYCEVDADDVSEETDCDSKRVAKKLRVVAEIGLNGIIQAGVRFILDRVSFDKALNSNTGYQSAATNTGYQSAATNTGDQSAATNTGYQSAATNTGYRSAASVSGMGSVAIATGEGGKAKGAIGCAIVVCERDNSGNILHIRSRIVDGINIKADTYYTMRKGRLVKAEGEK